MEHTPPNNEYTAGTTLAVKPADRLTKALQLAAFRYTSPRGEITLAVFPMHTVINGACDCGKACERAGKHPWTEHGVNEATTDPQQIQAWWAKHPHANIGVAVPEGVYVLDVDPRHGGRLDMLGENLPVTWMDRSGSGGNHVWFLLPDGVTARDLGTKLYDANGEVCPGIDIRRVGSSVICEGSSHASGGLYQWLHAPWDTPLALMPAQVLDRLRPRKPEATGEEIGDIPEGGRRDAILSLAGKLRHDGHTEPVILAACLQLNQDHCKPRPLSEQEVKATVHDVVKRYQPGAVPTDKRADVRVTTGERQLPEILSAPELLARNIQPPEMIVDPIIPVGATLLAAKPKSKKSFMMEGVGMDVAAGTTTLGRFPTTQCDVLYLALEDKFTITKARLPLIWGGADVPPGFHVASEWKKMDKGGADDLRYYLSNHRETRLVIVDTLKKVRPRVRNKNANAYDVDYDAAEILKEIADECNIAIVIIHHTRKATAEDIFDTISGSTGLTGAVNTLLVLEKGGQKDQAILHTTGKGVLDDEIGLVWHSDRCRWMAEGCAADNKLPPDQRKIVEYLRAQAKPLKPHDIAKGMSQDPDLIRQKLKRMRENDVVEADSQNRYSLTEDYQLHATRTTDATVTTHATRTTVDETVVSPRKTVARATDDTTDTLRSQPRNEGRSQDTVARVARVCTTLTDFTAVVDDLLAHADQPVSLDIETNGLSPYRNCVITLQLSREGGEAHVIDWRRADDDWRAQLRRLLAGVTLIGHNIAFDLAFLLRECPDATPTVAWDTMLARQLLSGGPKKGDATLEAVAAEIDLTVTKDQQRAFLSYAPDQPNWTEPFTADQVAYAQQDVAVLPPIAHDQRQRIADDGLAEAMRRELDAVVPFARLRATGVRVDVANWESVARQAEAEEAEAARAARGALGAINLHSSDQLLAALERLGVKLANTKRETLERANAPTEAAAAALDAALRWREANVIVTTFGHSWLQRVDGDGRVRADWSQIGSETGRIAVKEPNLANLPRHGAMGEAIRRCVIADDGHVLLAADYSNIEVRIAAEVSGDQALLDAFAADRDIHSETARKVFHLSEDVTDEEIKRGQFRDLRDKAKAVTFGILYGGTPYGLAKRLRVSQEEAETVFADFYAAYPDLHAWAEDQRDIATRTGVARTLGGFTRRLPLPFKPESQWAYDSALAAIGRKGVNTPVQGTGADIQKRAIALFSQRVSPADGWLVLTVHDELVVEARAEVADMVADHLAHAMRDAAKEFLLTVMVPLPEVAISDHWQKA